MKKNFLKSTFVVAIMAASATVGYMAYNQHQHQQMAFANPLLEENLEALADNWWDPFHLFDNDDEIRFSAELHSKKVTVTHTVTLQANIIPLFKFTSKVLNADGTITYTYKKEESKPCNMCVYDKEGPYKSCDDVPQKC